MKCRRFTSPLLCPKKSFQVTQYNYSCAKSRCTYVKYSYRSLLKLYFHGRATMRHAGGRGYRIRFLHKFQNSTSKVLNLHSWWGNTTRTKLFTFRRIKWRSLYCQLQEQGRTSLSLVPIKIGRSHLSFHLLVVRRANHFVLTRVCLFLPLVQVLL